MKDIFTMKAGEVYYLEKKDCLSLVISDTIEESKYFDKTVQYVFTRVTEMGNATPVEIYMGLSGPNDKEPPLATVLIPSISDKPISFAKNAIRNFRNEEVAELFPDEPVYVMTEEEREAMFCKLYGPKCPLSGKRCTACKGKPELPNAKHYRIIEIDGQGSD